MRYITDGDGYFLTDGNRFLMEDHRGNMVTLNRPVPTIRSDPNTIRNLIVNATLSHRGTLARYPDEEENRRKADLEPLCESWHGWGIPDTVEAPGPVPDADHYLANAKEALRKAREKESQFVGACKDCKYRRGASFGSTGRCINAVVQEVAYAEDDLIRKANIERCFQQRKISSQYGTVVCGPNGVLFEEKEPLGMRIWNWLFGD